jgi:hypothetical protein
MITENIPPDSVGQEAQDMLLARQLALNNIKSNLQLDQARMKKQADKKHTKRVMTVGDMAYLKLQLYKHNTLDIHKSLKLHSKYYGLTSYCFLKGVASTLFSM